MGIGIDGKGEAKQILPSDTVKTPWQESGHKQAQEVMDLHTGAQRSDSITHQASLHLAQTLWHRDVELALDTSVLPTGFPLVHGK